MHKYESYVQRAANNIRCGTNIHMTITGEALSMCRSAEEVEECRRYIEETNSDPKHGHHGRKE